MCGCCFCVDMLMFVSFMLVEFVFPQCMSLFCLLSRNSVLCEFVVVLCLCSWLFCFSVLFVLRFALMFRS